MKRVAPGTTLLCISMSSMPAMLACSKVDVLAEGKENRHSSCYVTTQQARNSSESLRVSMQVRSDLGTREQ